MNKYLSFVALLLLFSCSKEASLEEKSALVKKDGNSISLSEAILQIKASTKQSSSGIAHLGAGKSVSVDLSSLATGCFDRNDVSEVQLLRTHGSAAIIQPYHNMNNKFVAMYVRNATNTLAGSGYAVKYPFKHGAIYTISVNVKYDAYEVEGDKVQSPKRKPILQAQLSNDITESNTGCTTSSPVNLNNFTNNGIVHQLPNDNGNMVHSFTFTPDKCFDYLRFSALPNSGNSAGAVWTGDLTILETKGLDIIGPEMLNTNQESLYKVEYNGFPINSNFNWAVTGDLQIIGNAVGPNVLIKASSLKGGTIVASLNGCNILSKVIENTEMVLPHVQTYGPMYGGSPYNYSVSNVPNATSFTWEVGPGGQILSGQGDRTVVIIFDQISENTYDRDVSISVTAHGPFGSSPRATSYQTIRGCNSCPIQ
ncbi:hypothetical protein [Pedobacter sp. FW305-3-2-15-E-R2A2]|uniref:hypothetical protein n=1 Tax=Pedobacter sp. FW305-3-2-15-E-R2A2 TaxID=3140251 RepID=UPI00314094DB